MKKEYWFKNKNYGWGWYPATKEGWMVLLVYILLIAGMITFFLPKTEANMVPYFGGIVILTIALIIISWKTGEKPEWMWVGKPIGKK
ncbi:MAG: hypothetical protein AABX02_00900 [archaeon]